MDYTEAVAYLDDKIQFGIRPGLERIEILCDRLGNPQDSFDSIHIAGTNGKTSTARITSTILSALGLAVGTYTSPHLVCYTERFLVGDKPISQDAFARYLHKIIPLVEEVNHQSSEPLTHFEILTALAFYVFAQERLDCAVLETGMGGRWDATSIIHPRVAVLTNVDLEHTDRLGNTIREIAWEKAHIIKKGCSAIAGHLTQDALDIVQERCEQEEVDLKIFGLDFSLVSRKKVSNSTQLLSVKGLYGNYSDLLLPLAGEHQGENAATAIAACEAFLKEPLPKRKLKSAIQRVLSPGRFEIIATDPLVVFDGAHNLAGFLKLIKTLDQTRFNRLVLVLAILGDKDVDDMLQALVPYADLTIVTENHSERCMSASGLAKRVAKLTSSYVVEKPVEKALQAALKDANKEDLVLITGSLYTVGDAKKAWMLAQDDKEDN